MQNNDLKICSTEYSGLPVELIAKLEKPGNPADFLTMDDAQKLLAFIHGQRNLVNTLKARMTGLEVENQNLKRVLEETEAERDEAMALAEHFKQCAIDSQDEDWFSGFERVIDDDGNTLFDNEKAQILWDAARLTVNNGPAVSPKPKIKCQICEGEGIAYIRYGGVDECECQLEQEAGDANR